MSYNLVNKFGLHPPSSIQPNKKNLPLYPSIQTFRMNDLIHKNIGRHLPSNLTFQPNIPTGEAHILQSLKQEGPGRLKPVQLRQTARKAAYSR
jgi:hypothetical protein